MQPANSAQTLSALDLANLFLGLAEYEEPMAVRVALKIAPALLRYRDHSGSTPVTRSEIKEVLKEVGIADNCTSFKSGQLLVFTDHPPGYFVIDAVSNYPFEISISFKTRTGYWKRTMDSYKDRWPKNLRKHLLTFLTRARNKQRNLQRTSEENS